MRNGAWTDRGVISNGGVSRVLARAAPDPVRLLGAVIESLAWIVK
jgi:hypothetical protein